MDNSIRNKLESSLVYTDSVAFSCVVISIAADLAMSDRSKEAQLLLKSIDEFKTNVRIEMNKIVSMIDDYNRR